MKAKKGLKGVSTASAREKCSSCCASETSRRCSSATTRFSLAMPIVCSRCATASSPTTRYEAGEPSASVPRACACACASGAGVLRGGGDRRGGGVAVRLAGGQPEPVRTAPAHRLARDTAHPDPHELQGGGAVDQHRPGALAGPQQRPPRPPRRALVAGEITRALGPSSGLAVQSARAHADAFDGETEDREG